MTGFRAVAAAADRAMRDRSPDPVQPVSDECQELAREIDALLSDPITIYYGVGSEMAPAATRAHVARHGCQGWGQA